MLQQLRCMCHHMGLSKGEPTGYEPCQFHEDREAAAKEEGRREGVEEAARAVSLNLFALNADEHRMQQRAYDAIRSLAPPSAKGGG